MEQQLQTGAVARMQQAWHPGWLSAQGPSLHACYLGAHGWSLASGTQFATDTKLWLPACCCADRNPDTKTLRFPSVIGGSEPGARRSKLVVFTCDRCGT